MPYKRDKTHNEVIKALKSRCGGYWKDKLHPHHYAHIKGLHIAAYDTHKLGSGFPDWVVFIGWFCIFFEVKDERKVRSDPRGRKQTLSDQEYYYKELEPMEKFVMAHHPGIMAIVWEQNQIYEWLSLCADFVLYAEGNQESKSYLHLFFPKIREKEILQNDSIK